MQRLPLSLSDLPLLPSIEILNQLRYTDLRWSTAILSIAIHVRSTSATVIFYLTYLTKPGSSTLVMLTTTFV